MTLHDEIMNIPCEPIEGTESEVLAFKLGHKQALHAAAELADRSEQKLRDEVAALKNDLGLACALLDQATAYLASALTKPWIGGQKKEGLLTTTFQATD